MTLCLKCGLAVEQDVARSILPAEVPILRGAMTADDLEVEAPAAVAAIMSFGFCSGLDPAIPVGAVMLADTVMEDRIDSWSADRVWNERLSAIVGGSPVSYLSNVCYGLADTKERRAYLRWIYGAAAIDDESAAVAIFAARRGIPFVVLRVVVDDCATCVPLAARRSLPARAGPADLSSIISYLENHSQRGEDYLTRVAVNYGKALSALYRTVFKLGPSLQWW